MIFVCISRKYYSMPTAWNELSGDQLVKCLQVISSDWSTDKKELALLRILTGISRWRFLFADVDELAEFFYLLEFLFQDNKLTKNLLPAYDSLYGPGDNFCNLVVSEFIFAEDFYQKYKEQNNPVDLDNLIAVLYRPGKPFLLYNYTTNPDGDYRKKFNDHLVEYYASKIRKWPIEVKNAILHYYEGCHRQLTEAYGDVFGGSGEPAKRGMLSVVVSMAENGTFGNFAQVEGLLLHTFMIGLSEAIDKASKLTVKK